VIKDEKQYEITKFWLRRFEKSLILIEKKEIKDDTHPMIKEVMIGQCKSQIEEFKDDISDYEYRVKMKEMEIPVREIDDKKDITKLDASFSGL